MEASLAEGLAQWDQLPRKLAESLCGAWDLRHVETGAHVRRIAAYSEVLASAVDMSSHDALQLGHAALLHDIGKIAIPDAILTKPGRLTEQEFEIMKRHTTEGARLLSGVEHPLLQRAAVVALRHHERWNGSGYPDGLRGDACPLDARIVAVVDVYDALGHARCYKTAWSEERIATFFREGSGTQFEARIVDALFNCAPRLKQLAQEWPEHDSSARLKAHPGQQPV
jgi:putative two-component system response regulator